MSIQMQKKPDIQLGKRQMIAGKWNRNDYHIVRKLGSGTIGSVYLCVSGKKQVALKMSRQSTSISSEVNVLKDFGKVLGYHLGPSLIDVDYYIAQNGYMYSFYVMDYIKGSSLHDFIRLNGNEVLIPLL